jgi:hypothetical protein
LLDITLASGTSVKPILVRRGKRSTKSQAARVRVSSQRLDSVMAGCRSRPGLPTGSGTSPWTILAAIVIVVAPILVGMYLYRAAGRRTAR